MSERKARRAAEIAKRKAETKARLSAPVSPPTVPVALPWKRRARSAAPIRRATESAVWSTVQSGYAFDLPGSLVAAAAMAAWAGRLLRPR